MIERKKRIGASRTNLQNADHFPEIFFLQGRVGNKGGKSKKNGRARIKKNWKDAVKTFQSGFYAESSNSKEGNFYCKERGETGDTFGGIEALFWWGRQSRGTSDWEGGGGGRDHFPEF